MHAQSPIISRSAASHHISHSLLLIMPHSPITTVILRRQSPSALPAGKNAFQQQLENPLYFHLRHGPRPAPFVCTCAAWAGRQLPFWAPAL